MDISISTKFNVGDIVYTVYNYEDYWCADNNECIVQEIHIKKSMNETCVIYGLVCGNYSTRCVEGYCFGSYETAKEWCLRENDND